MATTLSRIALGLVTVSLSCLPTHAGTPLTPGPEFQQALQRGLLAKLSTIAANVTREAMSEEQAAFRIRRLVTELRGTIEGVAVEVPTETSATYRTTGAETRTVVRAAITDPVERVMRQMEILTEITALVHGTVAALPRPHLPGRGSATRIMARSKAWAAEHAVPLIFFGSPSIAAVGATSLYLAGLTTVDHAVAGGVIAGGAMMLASMWASLFSSNENLPWEVASQVTTGILTAPLRLLDLPLPRGIRDDGVRTRLMTILTDEMVLNGMIPSAQRGAFTATMERAALTGNRPATCFEALGGVATLLPAPAGPPHIRARLAELQDDGDTAAAEAATLTTARQRK